MNLIDELREEKIILPRKVAKDKCRVFEDNSSARTIATVPKYRPRAKHINIKYWHFIEHIEQGKIEI